MGESLKYILECLFFMAHVFFEGQTSLFGRTDVKGGTAHHFYKNYIETHHSFKSMEGTFFTFVKLIEIFENSNSNKK